MPVIPGKCYLLFRCEEVIQPGGGKVSVIVILSVPRISVTVEVVIRNLGGGLRDFVVYGEDRLCDWIELRRQAPGRGKIQHVCSSQLIGGAANHVCIDALLSVRRQHRDITGGGNRSVISLEIGKDEEFLLEGTKGNQRSAEISSVVVIAIIDSAQAISVSRP